MEKIIFLGTAGDMNVVGRGARSSGGIIIQKDDIQLHIDPGPGSISQARKFGVNPRATTCFLVSHAHINHGADLNAQIGAMTLSGLDKKGVVVANKTVINGDGELIPVLTEYHKKCIERCISLEAGDRVGIEDIEIWGVPVKHALDPNAIGFKICLPNYTLGYTGDTKYNINTVKELMGSDILILNVQVGENQKEYSGLNREDAIKIIEKVKPRLAVITHFGISMLRANPIVEAREIKKKTGVQTIAAEDGLSIIPSNYNANTPQKRLKLFED